MTIWITADLHLGHGKILTEDFSARPFATIDEHDEFVLDEINTHVARRDRLIIAGDFCWNNRVGHYRQRIRCREVWLIYGNHDKQTAGAHFSRALDTLLFKPRPGVQMFVSHYPHAYWPASHHGSLHVYGHCHTMRERTLDELFSGRRSMDIGLDNAKRIANQYRPFVVEEVCDLLLQRPGHDPVEWYRSLRG